MARTDHSIRARFAGIAFLGICLVLAILLLFDVTTPLTSGGIFAVALIVFGSLSRGFSRR